MSTINTKNNFKFVSSDFAKRQTFVDLSKATNEGPATTVDASEESAFEEVKSKKTKKREALREYNDSPWIYYDYKTRQAVVSDMTKGEHKKIVKEHAESRAKKQSKSGLILRKKKGGK